MQEKAIVDLIREICERFGPRPPGTAAEAKAARFIEETLKGFCDEVSLEEEQCNPEVARGSIVIFLVGYMLCLAAYIYVPTLAAILLGSLLLILYLMRFRGYEVLDQLFPRETTQNVIGKVKPGGTSRQVVIFSGHHDSTYAMPLFRKPYRRLIVPVYYSILGSHFVLVAAICTKLFGDVLPWLMPVSWFLFWVSVAGGLVFLLFQMFLFSKVPVMGANDNLAGVAVAVAAARHFAENRPQRTEVWAVSFGAEECGLRGSKRFARRHRVELSNAYLVNIEMVGAGEMIAVEGEKSGGTRHSPEVVSLITDSAKRCGISMSVIAAPFGETDATSFSRLGLKASTIAAIEDGKYPPNWHVIEDTPEHVDEAHLREALKVCIECVHSLERKA